MILISDYFHHDASFEERASLVAMRAAAWAASHRGDRRLARQIEDEERHGDTDFAIGKDGWHE